MAKAEPNAPKTKDTVSLLVAGGLAGMLTKTLTAPLERVKILLQLRSMSEITSSAPRSILGTMRSVMTNEGIISFWKGNGANCLRVVPVYALKFALYDKIKEVFMNPNSELSMLDKMKAGTVSGTITLTCCYPLDFVRTRLALASGLGIHYNGIFDCFRRTVQKEGMLALFNGYQATLLSGAPYVGLQMSGYEFFKERVPDFGPFLQPILAPMFAGMCGSIAAQTITFPGDTIKRRMQTNGAGGSSIYSGTWDCCRQIYAQDGLLGFYAGLRANIVRALPATAIQFLAYETFKKLLGQS